MEEGKGYICLGYGAIRGEVVSSRHLSDNRLIRMVAVWNEWLGVLLSKCINFRVRNWHRYPLLGYTVHTASYIVEGPITSLTNCPYIQYISYDDAMVFPCDQQVMLLRLWT